MTILVINSGSSSLKYGLFDMANEKQLLRGNFDALDTTSGQGAQHAQAVREVIELMGRKHHLTGVGHRVVHGGSIFHCAVRIDAPVLEQIRGLNHLAPLHNPACLLGIEMALETAPALLQVAVFDTAFFKAMPEYAWRYALPKTLADTQQVRRYGFHGISHQYVASAAAQFLGRPLESLRLITLHLGNGASATAIQGGRCIDTSMGMTPLEGLVMGTRSGDLDPSIITYLQRRTGMSLEEIEDLLNRESGLRGLCGETDMREIRRRAQSGDADARLAIEVFCHRLRKYIGAYVAVLGGIDGLIFTGGIGEHDNALRAEVCHGLEVMGICLDAKRNAAGDTLISPEGGEVSVLVIPTQEELAIARATHRCLAE